jgi:hypothetical protein
MRVGHTEDWDDDLAIAIRGPGYSASPMICLAGLKLKALERGDGIGQGKGVVCARHHMVASEVRVKVRSRARVGREGSLDLSLF